MLCGLTLLLLTIIFPAYLHFRIWPVAFFAVVPIAVCILHRPLKFRWLWLYYLTGFLYFSSMLFWLWPVTVGGTFVLSAYLAVYFPLFAVAFRRMVVDLRVPATAALPVAWTACEYVRGTFIEGGFPMLTVGNAFAGKGAFLDGAGNVLMQQADLLGVFGLTFFVMIFNGIIVDLLRLPVNEGKKKKANPAMMKLIGVGAGVFIAAIAYGIFRVQQTPGVTREGPMVAVIQENIPQEVKDSFEDYPANFASHMKLTEEAIEKYKPAMVVWPETTAPYAFNESRLQVMRQVLQVPSRMDRLEPRTRELVTQTVRTYEALCEISTRRGVHLLIGNMAVEETKEDFLQQNTAAMISPGLGEVKRYAKVHLVPFGEYVPFTSKGSWLRKQLLALTPMKQDYSLEPGKEWTIFELPTGSADAPATEKFRFATPICFEDIMPGPSRAMAKADASGKKGVDFLVSVSNDGWFFEAELDLHLQACQIRAVENRVAIARAVNTGNSGVVDSCGRVKTLIDLRKVGVTGMRLPIDSRVTLYSRIGDLLPILSGIAAVLMVAWTLVRPRRGKKS
jgi:apolipoprotein N-acyltransferase